MQKRKKTPDILSNLMDSKNQDDGKPANQNTSKPESAEKIKATYYISQSTVDALEGAWFQLRKEASPEIRTEITKSTIVDVAIRIALDELDKHGKDSHLASKMLHHNTSAT